MKQTGDKPIEGHIADLGFDPKRLSDEERHEIALAFLSAYITGVGVLMRERGGFIHQKNFDEWKLVRR